jgi:2-amino-4-hydroxy-6-hydroxymethyldihydropteridine diphosphokinase
MPAVAIALGSNIGDRRAHLEFAVDHLKQILTNARVSTVIETAPVDVPDSQPPYLNAALAGETSLSATELMAELDRLERVRGRERASFRAARTLDLDLILYGDAVIQTAAIAVPHPRFRERHFVLEPLNEIAPDMVDPVTGLTVGELLGRAAGKGQGATGS